MQLISYTVFFLSRALNHLLWSAFAGEEELSSLTTADGDLFGEALPGSIEWTGKMQTLTLWYFLPLHLISR